MITIDQLKTVPLFKGLTDEQLQHVAGIATERALKKGDALFKPGDKRDACFVVLGGQMHVFRSFAGEVQTLAILDAHDFIVETALTDPGLTHEHSGEALTDGSVLILDGNKFVQLRKEHTETAALIYSRIIQNLTERLHHANNKIVTIYSTGKIAATYGDLDNLTDLLLSTILEIIHAKRALFALFSPRENKAVIRSAKGYGSDQGIMNLDVSLVSDPILGALFKSSQNIVITEEQYKREDALHTPYSSRNMLGVPLYSRSGVIGAILLGDKEGGEFSHNNQILLSIIAKQIVLSIVTAETAEQQRA